MYAKNVLGIFRLVLLLFNICYFSGCFWLMYCELSLNYKVSTFKSTLQHLFENHDVGKG